MKKIIGILGIAVFAMVLLFNVDSLNNSNADLDLSNLMAMNKANAEEGGWFEDEENQTCLLGFESVVGSMNPDGSFNIIDIYTFGTETICTGWGWGCTAVACG